MNLILAPGKIAIKQIEAKLKGGLFLPPSRAKAFDIAEITAVGRLDRFGTDKKDLTTEAYKPGNIVLFQLPVHVANFTSHRVKGELNIFLSVRDVVARLDSPMVDLENFHIAGNLVLLRPTARKTESLIIVPDAAEEAKKESIQYSVMQKGADVTIDIFTGQEVFPNRGRTSTIVIDNQTVCFVDQEFIDGVMAP